MRRDRGNRGGGVDTRGPKVEPLSPFMSERTGMFSPRSSDILEHLSPRRRDVLLGAFPVRGQSVNSISSSVSMAFVDATDFDQQEDPSQVKVSTAQCLHTCSYFRCQQRFIKAALHYFPLAVCCKPCKVQKYTLCGRLPTLATSGDMHCGLLPLQYSRPCDGRQWYP